MVAAALSLACFFTPVVLGQNDIIVGQKSVWEKGVHTLNGGIFSVEPGRVEITERTDRFQRFPLRLEITEASRLERVDPVAQEGKFKLTSRSMSAKDLRRGQNVSVVYFHDGAKATLIYMAISGADDRGAFFEFVDKLGGKISTRFNQLGSVFYAVDLSGTKVRDADLALLAFNNNIFELNLSGTAITDKSMDYLAGMGGLTVLRLNDTQVTDAAIPALKKIPKVDSMGLANTKVTEKGLESLLANKIDFHITKAATGKSGLFQVNELFVNGKLEIRYLMIGDTYFGNVLFLNPLGIERNLSRHPTTYYHPHGPVGQVMKKWEWFSYDPLDAAHPADSRMPASLVGLGLPEMLFPMNALVGTWSEPPFAVVRLNTGTPAIYGRPYQHVHFFNDSPELLAFSKPAPGKPRYFQHLVDAENRGCAVKVYSGEERTQIAKKAPQGFYRTLLVEIARNGLQDINTPLMTKEGMADVMACLAEDGVACYHISHRNYVLKSVFMDAAQALGLAWRHVQDEGGHQERRRDDPGQHFGSEWVMIARKSEYLDHFQDTKTMRWTVPEATGKNLWRDGQPHNLKALARPLFTK